MNIRVGLLFIATIAVTAASFGQSNRDRRLLLNEYVAPEELVSMSKTLPFDKAVSIFSEISKKYLNKIIVDPTDTKKPIGVDIQSMYWLQAFETILRANNLWYEEKEEYFQVYNMADSAQTTAGGGAPSARPAGRDTAGYMLFKTRDVKISSVFFSVDVVKSLNAGINWNFFYAGDTTQVGATRPTQFVGNLNTGVIDPQTTPAAQLPAGFVGKVIPSIKFSNVNALISLFQQNNLGDVISSPELVVTSGKKGRIQVGQDFFITQRDFAGNTIQQQQSTGVIIDVTPTVYAVNGTDFINLDVTAERSTIGSSSAGPTINRSSAKTFCVLLNGEETVIGGLYTTQVTTERGGIPFLKDLPWWFFGLRYVFGYDKTSDTKDELIILLKAEIVPTLEERVAQKVKEENLIEKQREAWDKDIQMRRSKK